MRTTADKYWFVRRHPHFLTPDVEGAEFDIEIHNVCPETNRIEKYPPLNTKPQIWIELMTPYYMEDDKKWILGHDHKFDGGGFTMDEAIDDVYQRVLELLGDYTEEDYKKKWDEVYNPTTGSFSSAIMHQILDDTKIWEDAYGYTFDHMGPDEYDAFVVDTKDLKQTLEVLKKHILIVPPEKIEEVQRQIDNTEHDIWVHEMSLARRIDYT